MSNESTQYDNSSSTPVKELIIPETKPELVSASDEVLLHIVQKAKGHTKDDFQSHMNVTYGYDAVTSELKRRGYISGWYKPSDSSTEATYTSPTIIIMKRNETKPIRKNYSIDPIIAAEWEDFNRDIPFKTITMGNALRLFMDSVRSGKIIFKIEIQ